MSDEDAVGEGSHEAVAFFGEDGGDAFVLWFEGRQNQQSAGGERRLEFGFQMHAEDASGRDPDHWLAPAQQDVRHDVLWIAGPWPTGFRRDVVRCLQGQPALSYVSCRRLRCHVLLGNLDSGRRQN